MTKHWIGALVASLCLLGASDAMAQGRKGRKKRDKAKRGKRSTAAKATIILRAGDREINNAEILEEKFKEIKYKERGRRQESIAGEKVLEIVYDDAHPGIASGQSQHTAGLFEKAVTSFTNARNAAEADSPGWFYATYWLGEAQLGAGSFEDAGKEFARFLSKDKDHFLAPNAIFGLGKAYTGQKKFADAASTFAKLDEGFGSDWSAMGQLGRGDAALAENNPSKARKAFKFAEDRARSNPDLRRAAKVGTGKSYVQDKRWKDALSFFDGIIGEPGVAPDVAAGAWVGKGDCRVAQAAEKSNDKNLLKEALIAYQTCVVRYAGTEAYPKALFQSASLYEKLGLEQQAGHMREELKSRCPSSKWAEKLKK